MSQNSCKISITIYSDDKVLSEKQDYIFKHTTR